MNIVTLSGTVANTSDLPTFNDVFPSLVEPSKIILKDEFSGGAGVMNNRSLEQSDSAQKWLKLGSAGDLWQVYAGGYAAISADIAKAIVSTTHKTSGKLYAAIEYGGVGFVGLELRFVDQVNTFQVTLSDSGGTHVRIDKIVAGANSNIGIHPVTLTAGKIYHLGVTYTTAGFDVYLDNVKITTTTDAAMSGNTGVGLVSNKAAHKVWEFVAG